MTDREYFFNGDALYLINKIDKRTYKLTPLKVLQKK